MPRKYVSLPLEMSNIPENIHPADGFLSRHDKEMLLQQTAKVIWFTGLSGSGKSTIARLVEEDLYDMGYMITVLDGDNVRTGINNNLGFSEQDRSENIRRVAETAKLFLNNGVITLNCFVSPTESLRKVAKDIIGDADFIEVYINASFEECEQRDVKGLYKKARAGEIKNFTGLDAPFEAPTNAHLTINTANEPVEESARKVMEYILPLIKYHL